MVQTDIQPFSNEQENILNQPLDASLIKHRPGAGGRQLSYIKGKTAIDTANRVFGHGKWGYKVLSRSLERTTDADGNLTGEFYTADIELSVSGADFPFPGDGIGIVVPPRNGPIAEAHEKARKEAVTDALKRALRHYGSQFGNDLYDEDAYVDAGEGVLVKVKDVSRTPPTPQKRVVEAQKPPVAIEAPKSVPTPDNSLKTRLNAVYNAAVRQSLIKRNATPEEFLVYISTLINANITHVDQITESRLHVIEQFITQQKSA